VWAADDGPLDGRLSMLANEAGSGPGRFGTFATRESLTWVFIRVLSESVGTCC
jgi:hypothetical protein